ncbi:MAG TPA: Rrf2 family transcriptional regulator [Anaeromyxobacteraceae bacterium]|nr:Rrf2 family transcriptional regulator [Anaeromyxobacteraceae bacterium]
MKPSQKADYALRAAVDLAVHESPEEFCHTAAIARRTGTPSKFLEAILGQLRQAGLVESRRGAGGGHRLARPAGLISAGEVWRAVDGPVSLASRSSRRPRGRDGAGQAIRGLWEEVEEVVQRTVEGVSLEDLARRARETSSAVDYSI